MLVASVKALLIYTSLRGSHSVVRVLLNTNSAVKLSRKAVGFLCLFCTDIDTNNPDKKLNIHTCDGDFFFLPCIGIKGHSDKEKFSIRKEISSYCRTTLKPLVDIISKYDFNNIFKQSLSPLHQLNAS